MNCSDKNRRSMAQALQTGELSEDARAFVAGKAPPGSEELAVASPKPLPQSPRPSLPTPAPRQNGVPKPTPMDSSPSVAGIVSITIRLPASLPSRLLRASVERKLRREQPFSQQDIVAEALHAWLDLHGYAE